jgi:cytochrome P450
MWLELCSVLLTLSVCLYFLLLEKSTYWTKLSVKQPSYHAYPFGNHPMTMPDAVLGRVSANEVIKRQYNEFKDVKYYGTYGAVTANPMLVIKELDLIEHILVRDFSHFTDRSFGGIKKGRGTSPTDQMWKKQLLSLKGEDWRTVKSTFSSIFTAGRMKMLGQIMWKISEDLEKAVSNTVRGGDNIDLYSLCGKFSMENSATSVFGVSTGTFSRPKRSPLLSRTHSH